jgi:AcrR family transcriptional regulator
MGIAERREREKEQRRNDIIDAAESVFFRKGWQGATMDDVAEAAELSKATLYLYFKNKEELYAAIVVRGHKLLSEMFKRAVEGAGTGIEQSAAIGRAYMEFHEQYRNYYEAMMYFDARGMEACEDCEYTLKCVEHRDELMGLVAGTVRRGIEDGTMRPDLDPDRTAVLLWAQSSGVLQVLATAGDKIREVYSTTPEEILDTFFEFVFYQIAADSEQAIRRRPGGNDMEKS